MSVLSTILMLPERNISIRCDSFSFLMSVSFSVTFFLFSPNVAKPPDQMCQAIRSLDSQKAAVACTNAAGPFLMQRAEE